jgi:hypothetical protein
MRLAGAILMMLSPLGLGSSDAIAMGANPIQFVTKVQCPPLKTYTAAQSKQIGEARKKLRIADPKSILLDANDDYLLLRDQCRAIETK